MSARRKDHVIYSVLTMVLKYIAWLTVVVVISANVVIHESPRLATCQLDSCGELRFVLVTEFNHKDMLGKF